MESEHGIVDMHVINISAMQTVYSLEQNYLSVICIIIIASLWEFKNSVHIFTGSKLVTFKWEKTLMVIVEDLVNLTNGVVRLTLS